MKIVITTKSFFPILGGSVNYAAMLAEGFIEAGHEVILLTRTPSEKEDDFPYKVIRNANLKERFKHVRWCNVVLQVDSSIRDIWPFILWRKKWVPTIHRAVSYQDYCTSFENRLRFIGEWLCYYIGDTVLVSEGVKEKWKLNKLVIDNPYDDEIFNYLDAHPKEFDFVFIGRVVESKGILHLVQNLKEIILKYPDREISLAVVGAGGAEDELKEEVEQSASNFHCKLYGHIDAAKVADVLRKSKTMVLPTLPSWGEASPLSLLEAQACGCLIICADNGGAKYNCGKHSEIYECGNKQELYQKLENNLTLAPLKADELDTELLSSRSLKKVVQRYVQHFESI